jgi:putative redox protein
MSSELRVSATHQGGMRVTGGTPDFSVAMDYPLAPGEAVAGLTPLQLLLTSLAGCSANALMILLQRRLKQEVTGLEVEVVGQRRDEHPTVLTHIDLRFTLRGRNVDPAAVERAIRISEEQICPVWAMLRPGTTVVPSFVIVAEDAA